MTLSVGLAYSRINLQLAQCLCILWSAAFTFLTPHITTVPILLSAFVLNQMGLGALDSGTNMFLLHLWGKETAPFMQAVQLMFGAGALVAPLIAVPFLYENESRVTLSNNTDDIMFEVFHEDKIDLLWPYSINGSILLLGAIFAFAVWRAFPHTLPHPSRQSDLAVSPALNDAAADPTSAPSHENDLRYKSWKLLLLILSFLFAHINLGLMIAFGSFLTTFAVQSDLHLSKGDGAHLTTVFWSTFTIFRILTIFSIDYVGHEVSIFASLAVILVANILLVPFGDSSLPILWTGVALVGVGMSSIWACLFGFLEQQFPVTPLISAFMIVFAVLGEFVFPALISSFIEAYARILLWVTLFCSVSNCILFIAMSLIARHKLRQR